MSSAAQTQRPPASQAELLCAPFVVEPEGASAGGVAGSVVVVRVDQGRQRLDADPKVLDRATFVGVNGAASGTLIGAVVKHDDACSPYHELRFRLAPTAKPIGAPRVMIERTARVERAGAVVMRVLDPKEERDALVRLPAHIAERCGGGVCAISAHASLLRVVWKEGPQGSVLWSPRLELDGASHEAPLVDHEVLVDGARSTFVSRCADGSGCAHMLLRAIDKPDGLVVQSCMPTHECGC